MNRLVMTLMVSMVACSSSGDDEQRPDAFVGGGGNTCTAANDTCTGDTLCIGGRCEAAFPRVYTITNIVHTVGTTNPTGSEWDVGGGAPDLFVVISVNGAMVATTPVVDDQFSATFAGPFNVSLIAGSSLKLTSFDEDISSNDPGYNCEAAPITAALLRNRGLGCDNAAWSMTFRVMPQ